MKRRFARDLIFLVTALLFSPAIQAHAATIKVGWNSDNGFSPNKVTINSGDTIVWTDNDPDFPTQVISDNPIGQPNYFQFFLVNQDDAYEVVFNSTGTVGYSDSYGHAGSITVNGLSPVSITLSSPRLSEGRFLFDATGLTPGKTNVLENSTNLSNWTAIKTNAAVGSSATFTNLVISSIRFYRVSQLP